MNVLIIGGTGLLGFEGAKTLIERGHTVTSLSLPPIPPGAQFPDEMKNELGNFMELSDQELAEYLRGCDGLVFAAGIDERCLRLCALHRRGAVRCGGSRAVRARTARCGVGRHARR